MNASLGNRSLQCCIRCDGSHWYIQDILFICTWNILQDRPHQTFSPTTILWNWMSNKRKKIVRSTSPWRWTNSFLNSHQVTEKVRKEIPKFLEHHNSKSMRSCKGSSKRRDYSTAFLPQEIRKTLNRQIIIHLKQMKNNKKNNNNNIKYNISIRENKP